MSVGLTCFFGRGLDVERKRGSADHNGFCNGYFRGKFDVYVLVLELDLCCRQLSVFVIVLDKTEELTSF